ncbi:MAG: PLP-dependent aminotransferase family protein [Hellea sp.]
MGLNEATFQLKWDLKTEDGSLTQQLSAQIRDSISSGQLLPGDRVPPTRRLAEDLGVARGTVSTAMELLIAEGILEARIGSGTYVAKEAILLSANTSDLVSTDVPLPSVVPVPDIDCAAPASIDFRPCRPSLEAFPLQAWRRCMSIATSRIPNVDYGDPRGDANLRQTIQDYLRRSRGLTVDIEEIIITNGAVHAMHILSALYLDSSASVVFETPGYPLARQTFELSGANIHYCRVDEAGLILEDLPRSGSRVKFVYVTPSHQFPTGGRLSLGRRRALISWAIKNKALIIEDDYDGEFRYDVPPLVPMASMSPSSVVYCGTFSKTMFPGLRIGFAIAPKPIIEAMAAYRTISEYAPNAPAQQALSQFIADGHYERHIHRMRRIYAAKRKQVSTTLSQINVNVSLAGLDSGLSVLLRLGDKISARRISKEASEQGILIPAIGRYDFNKSVKDDALIFGYAEPSLKQIQLGLRTIFDRKSAT